jgi:hypothetical protein
MQTGAPEEFLKALRQYAIDAIDPEVLYDRRDIGDDEPVEGTVPDWMYLRGKTLESHKHFHHWCKVIKEDLQCDDRACQSFIKLFNMNPPGAPHGYGEACRVLAHIFKDKSKAPDDVIGGPRGWSRFLQKACEETVEALENHADVKGLKHSTSSWKDWNAYTPSPPGHSGPGDAGPLFSSSDTKGMGKGQGKVLQHGPR